MQLQIATNPNENANGAKKRAVAKGIVASAGWKWCAFGF